MFSFCCMFTAFDTFFTFSWYGRNFLKSMLKHTHFTCLLIQICLKTHIQIYNDVFYILEGKRIYWLFFSFCFCFISISHHQFFISCRWKILLGNMRHPVSSFSWVSWGEIKTQTAILQLFLGHIFFVSYTPPPTTDIPGGTAWTFSQYNMRMLCDVL